jgi:hypothetical protein
MSVAIASNRVLHARIVEAVGAGLDRLKAPDFANPPPSP